MSSSVTPKFERKRRRKFENGKVVEYWEDVPIVPPPSESGKPNAPTELYKEWKFDEDISLGRIFPSVKGTRFDAFVMKNTIMIWLAKDATATRKAGLWLETDVEFQGMLSPAADVLRDVFKQEKPGIHLLAHLGVQQDWNDELVATGFTFKGSIDGMNVGFGDFLMFRNAGLMLTVLPNNTGGTEKLWSFYGVLHLNIPNSTVPLVMQYQLMPKAESLDMSMTFGTGEKWLSVFGVSGLNLDEVRFDTRIDKSDIKRSLEFSITAKWSLGDIPVELTGRFDRSGAYLRGYIKTLSLNDIRKLFSNMTEGGNLDEVEQDIRFNELTLEISKGRLLLSGEVWVDSYKVAAAEVLISVDGVRVSGAVDNLHIGDDVCVEEARLELIIGKMGISKAGATHVKPNDGVTDQSYPSDQEPKQALQKVPVSTSVVNAGKKGGTAVAAIIRGKVEVKAGDRVLHFDVIAAITKGSNGSVSYFVYGVMDCENFSIGKLLSEGTLGDSHPMNLHLNRVAVMACNMENGDDFGLNVARYPIKKGVFVCAELSTLPYVDQLSKVAKADDRFVLQAGYSPTTGFSVHVNLPENIRIEFSPNFVSSPLVLSIETQPSLAVTFGAKLWYTPHGQIDPLEFTLALRANDLQATAFAQMDGWWMNPLDLSPRLKIGPRLVLEVEVIYEQFLATGLPSGVGFEGAFVVDDVDVYKLAFNLGSNPKEILVNVKAKEFNAKQVINLINSAADFELEKPEGDLIRFQDVNVYASPLGCLLGTQSYPPGFVVQGKAFIFGKKVEIDCSLGSSGLKLKGEVEDFNLGPLAIRGGKRADGARDKNPIIDFEITRERQHFEVSGSISLWDLEVSIQLLAELFPDTQLEFNFELAWSDLLKFQVDGKLLKNADNEKSLPLHKLDDADFQLHAVMEQRILSSISQSMKEWFKSASVSVQEGIADAKLKVDEAQKNFREKCEQAEAAVDEARANFNAKMEKAQGDLRQKREQIAAERAAKEKWMLEEERRAEKEIQDAKCVLDSKLKDFEDSMEAKKRDLATETREAEDSLNGKIRDLQDKRVSVQNDFGNAIEALKQAEDRVRDEDWRVQEADQRLSRAQEELSNAAWYDKPFLLFKVSAAAAEKSVVWLALEAAQLILRGARAVVEGPVYQAAMFGITTAEGAVNLARDAVTAVINGMQAALDAVVCLYAKGIEVAKTGLETAQRAALGIRQAAWAARDALYVLQQEALKLAEDAVEAVARGIEFVAFQTALAALEFAKNDTTLVDIAKAGLDAAEAVAQAALAAASALADALMNTLNIELVELTGSLRAIVGGGGAFTIRVKGIVCGESFDLKASWSPRDMIAFIIDICKVLWARFLKTISL